MNIKPYRFFLLLFVPIFSFSQESLKRVLSLEESETILLKENLVLLAERLEVPMAEAERIQAKVWPNPTLTVDEVNLWTTEYQKKTGEQLPGLFGNDDFGKYRQISAQIEQLVETAGKRRKRIALSEVSAAMAQSYLEDFLLNLKAEFRKTVHAFHFHERYADMLERQRSSLETIVSAYRTQYDQRNVNKAELIRLEASLFGIKDDLIEEQKAINELTQTLVVLLNLPSNTVLSFTNVFHEDDDYQLPFAYTLEYLQEAALQNRPYLKLSELEVKRSHAELAYEKAMAVPDVDFSLGYDRGGNILQDFVGIGFSMDLPFFNKNKGNIKKAELAIQQQNYLKENKVLQVKEEVRKDYNNLTAAAHFLKDINRGYMQELDDVMAAYTEYFKLQSINIITYMDFLESYIETKKSILENQQEFLDDKEDLMLSTGIEIKKT